MAKLKVGILMGGPSAEHNVSLETGKNIIENLDKRKYQPVPIKISKRNYWLVSGKRLTFVKALKKINLVFNALHGTFGEDGTVQGLLESLGIPYTGSGILTSALAMDKPKSRMIFKEKGLDVPQFYLSEGKISKTLAGKIKGKQDWLVKPINQGSSIGITIVKNKNKIAEAIKKALLYSRPVMIEEYLQGREVTGAILGNFRNQRAYPLPIIEIIPPKNHNLFDYQVKYDGTTKEIVPAKLSKSLTKKVQETARRAYLALDCQGYARVDMIISRRKVYVLELNTLPGLTKESLVPKAAEKASLSFPKLLDHIIKEALAQKK